MDAINDIRTIISKGKLQKAIETLWTNFENHEFKDNVVAIRSRFNSLNDNIINGLLSTPDALIEENKITFSLLKFLNKIEADQTEKVLDNVNQKLDSPSLVNKLLEILKETYKGMHAQAAIRNRLYINVKERLSLIDSLEYEDFFDTYYGEMNEEELEYHNSIRDYTENILNVYNRKALELILGNKELKDKIPLLYKLERHLLVWLGKYEHLFKAMPSLSLVYAGVKENVPFPYGLEAELEKYLNEHK